MKKTALFLFMLFAFVMKAQEIPETFYIGEDQIIKTKYYMKTKDQVLINCKYKKMGLITSVAYTKNDVHVYSTEVIDDYLVKEESMPPSSTGEYMIKAACTFYDKMSNQNQE